MPQNPARKARTRAEILDHAARLFRLRGHAGTNIDDIMLAAGLTRGAFYAHFTSKDDLFAEAIRTGQGLLRPAAGRRAAGGAEGLSRQDESRGHRAGLHPGRPARRRRPRDRWPPGWPMPTSSMRRSPSWRAASLASSMPTRRWRRSSRSAPSPWRAPRATRGSATGCCAAPSGPSGPSSSRELRQRRNDRGHAGKPLALVGPNALHDHAVVGPQPDQRRVLLQPGDELFRAGRTCCRAATARPPSRRHRCGRPRRRGTAP